MRINKPSEWGLFYFTQPDVYIHIPQCNDVSTKITFLIIYLFQNAPAYPYTMTIRASCDTLGRINGCNREDNFEFTPAFYPCLNIECDNVVQVKPAHTTNIPINITNCGNKKSRVVSYCIDCDADFLPMIYPSLYDINFGESYEFDFIATTPPSFNGVQIFELGFKSVAYPPLIESPIITVPLFIILYYP